MSPATIRIVSLVELKLALHKQLPGARTPHEMTALERQIEATDGKIDGVQAERSDGKGDKNRGGQHESLMKNARPEARDILEPD